MATFVNGILGGFSGKVGTVIGGCWNGINYMRSIAASITDAKTPAQLEQRAKFSVIIKFLRPLTAFLRLGFKSAAIKKSAFNAAMAYNLKNAIKGVYPIFEVDYPKAMVSRGLLVGALNPALTATQPGKVNFTWDDNSYDSNASPDDEAILVLFNILQNKAVVLMGGSTRESGLDTLDLPESFSGDQTECFLCFANAEGNLISDSVYAGNIQVL